MDREKLLEDLTKVLGEELVQKMKNTPQSPKWHPEGDVLEHTLLVMNQAKEDLNLYLAAMLHDIGKVDHTRVEGEKITAYGHEVGAVFWILTNGPNLRKLYPDCDVPLIGNICNDHMRAHLYKNYKMSNKHKRAAFENLIHFEKVMKFSKYDSLGKEV